MSLMDASKSGIVDLDLQNERGLAYVLGVKGVQSNPNHVDMTTVRPVIDMNMQGYSKLHDYDEIHWCNHYETLTGQTNHSINMIAYGNQIGVNNQIVVPLNHNMILWGIEVYVLFTGAGIAAFAGNDIFIALEMYLSGARDITKWCGSTTTVPASAEYWPGTNGLPTLSRDNMYVIPATAQVRARARSTSGVAFPAGTSLRYKALGQCFPIGAPLPMNI
jgi:hypothetical protein